MARRQWFNQSQPTTLQVATFLLYFEGVTGFLDSFNYRLAWLVALKLAVSVAAGFGAYGIANNSKRGFQLAVIGAFGPMIVRFSAAIYAWITQPLYTSVGPFDVLIDGTGLRFVVNIFSGGTGIYGYIFEIALIAALLHRQSTEYRRIWFT